jgi:hypothetical protein
MTMKIRKMGCLVTAMIDMNIIYCTSKTYHTSILANILDALTHNSKTVPIPAHNAPNLEPRRYAP